MYVSRTGDAYSIALQGMRSSQQMLLDGARQIAFGNMDGYADALVEIMRARHSFAANVKVVQVQQEMDRSLLDIVA
jgi:hypothetical protein